VEQWILLRKQRLPFKTRLLRLEGEFISHKPLDNNPLLILNPKKSYFDCLGPKSWEAGGSI
jgi:hypothetical protein